MRIEPHQSRSGRADPEHAVPIEQQGTHGHGRQASGVLWIRGEMGEVPPVEIVSLAMHANPQPPLGVRNETADIVNGRAVGVLGIMAKMLDVPSIQPV